MVTLKGCLGYQAYSGTVTIGRCAAMAAIEATYYATLSGYPESLAHRGLRTAGTITTDAPKTIIGTGYAYHVPPVVDFSGGGVKGYTAGATPIVAVSAYGVQLVAAQVQTDYDEFPEAYITIELIATETSPAYIFSYNDLKVDTRITAAAGATTVFGVKKAHCREGFNLADPELGRYAYYNVFKPFTGSVSGYNVPGTNITQVRVGFPSLALTSVATPVATMIVTLEGIIGGITAS